MGLHLRELNIAQSTINEYELKCENNEYLSKKFIKMSCDQLLVCGKVR